MGFPTFVADHGCVSSPPNMMIHMALGFNKFNKELQKIHHQLSDLPDDLTLLFRDLNSSFKDKITIIQMVFTQ